MDSNDENIEAGRGEHASPDKDLMLTPPLPVQGTKGHRSFKQLKLSSFSATEHTSCIEILD